MRRLALRYDHDEKSVFDERLDRDDFGRLTVSVRTAQFSGSGGVWVQWQDAKAFGESLSAFPIAPERPVKAAWGYNGETGDGLILGVVISPANATGDLLVSVEVADDAEPGRRVRTAFLTNSPHSAARGAALSAA